jgi:hypothetical protein
MVRVLAVMTKSLCKIMEYVVLQRDRYESPEAFLAVVRAQTEQLWTRYGLPNDDLELFDGGARTVESFFCMFPNLKLTPLSVKKLDVSASNLYRLDAKFGRVRITAHDPLVGELVPTTGGVLLMPEEDKRSGNVSALKANGLTAAQRMQFTKMVVQVTGVYDDAKVVNVEKIALKTDSLPK